VYFKRLVDITADKTRTVLASSVALVRRTRQILQETWMGWFSCSWNLLCSSLLNDTLVSGSNLASTLSDALGSSLWNIWHVRNDHVVESSDKLARHQLLITEAWDLLLSNNLVTTVEVRSHSQLSLSAQRSWIRHLQEDSEEGSPSPLQYKSKVAAKKALRLASEASQLEKSQKTITSLFGLSRSLPNSTSVLPSSNSKSRSGLRALRGAERLQMASHMKNWLHLRS
jgi:hypothetical protein